MRKLFTILAVFGLMLAMGSSARADQISFNLSTIANDGSGGPLHGGTTPLADLVTVTVTTCQDSAGFNASYGCNTPGATGPYTEATVEFSPAAGSSLPGGDVSAPALIKISGAFSCTTNDGGPGCSSDGSFDTFGAFSVESGSVSQTDIIFDLTAVSGNSWTSAAGVLTPTTGYDSSSYSHGFEAAVGFFANGALVNQGSPGQSPSNDAEDAGYYTATTPEPMSLLLLGGCLLVVGRKLAAHLA